MIMKMVKAMSNRSRTAVCPNTQYQYSERVALPENTAYLEITDLAAVSRLYPLKADACVSGGTFYIGDLKCVNYLLRISFGKLLLVRSLEKWSRMMELHGIRLLKERRMQPLFSRACRANGLLD